MPDWSIIIIHLSFSHSLPCRMFVFIYHKCGILLGDSYPLKFKDLMCCLLLHCRHVFVTARIPFSHHTLVGCSSSLQA